MMIPELTVIKIFADARTEPYVPSGTEVLLVQDGKVMVGRLHYEPGDTMSIHKSHPSNHSELDTRATQLVREKFPEYLKSEVALTLVCPRGIAADMIWDE